MSGPIGTARTPAPRILEDAARAYARASSALHTAVWGPRATPPDLDELQARVHDALEDLKAAATACAKIRHAKTCRCLRRAPVYRTPAVYRTRTP